MELNDTQWLMPQQPAAVYLHSAARMSSGFHSNIVFTSLIKGKEEDNGVSKLQCQRAPFVANTDAKTSN